MVGTLAQRYEASAEPARSAELGEVHETHQGSVETLYLVQGAGENPPEQNSIKKAVARSRVAQPWTEQSE